MNCSWILLGLIHTTMNSPTRHEKHDAEDGQLSPVLGRKRYPRRPTRKSQKESKEEQVKTKSPEKSPLPKPLNSFIPVPIKDTKDAKDLKKHPNVSKSHEVHDTQETSSTRLTNFKQEVLTNCAKIAFAEVGASNKVTSIRFHKYSVSEGTLKYKTLETPNKSGSDSKVVDHFQQKCPRTKGHTKDGRYHKEDIKSASGDISEDHNETVMRIPKAHLDMLYENKLFFGGSGSKTTLDSCSPSIAPSLSPSSKESDVSEKKTKSVCNKVEAFDQEQCSQPNYSETRDATVGNTAQTTVTTHAQQRSSPDKERGYKNKMKSAFLTKDLLKFEPAQITTQPKPEDKEKHAVSAKLTPNLAQEVLGWNEGDLDNLHQDGDTAAPFQGFTIEEIELTEKKFEQSKNFQQQRQRKTVVTTKKKLRRSIASELNKMEEKMDVNKTPPKLEPSKNVEHNGEITKPDESIAVGTNNRVQICIGNNRIQINIKSDKKQECVVSNKSEDTPIAAKAIEMPLQCKAGLEKSKSHGFWSYSTDESKKCVPTKRVYNNADDYSICNEHKRKGCEISTSGFKSESEQQDIPKVEGVPQKDIEKFPGIPINLDRNFPSTSGSKSSKMGRLESEMDTETTLTSSPMELMEASSEDTLQAKEVPEMPKHLEGRKILKARSLLGRRTPEGTITGNNIRKSLFSKDFDDAEKPKSADIVEFGKVDSFKFDFQTAFKSASGKNISLSPEKLKAASRLLDYDGTSSEEDLILCNANVAKLKNVTNNLTEDDIKVVPHKKLDRSAVLARRLSFDQDQVEDNNPGPSKVEMLGGFIRASASGRKFSVDADKPPNSSSFFDDIHLPDIKSKRDKFAGFTSASGKKLSVDPDKYKKAASLFPEDAPNETEVNYRKIGDDTKGPGKNSPILLNNNKQKETASNFTGFSSASGKKLTLDPEKLCMANLKFGNDQPSGCDNISFSSASGKKLNTSTEKIKLASSIFQDTEVSKIEPERSTNESLQTSSIKHQHDKTINIQEVDKFVGFTSASGKRLSLDSARIQRASSLFEDTETKTSLSPKSGFSRTSSKKIIVDLEKIKRASSLFKDDGNTENPKDSKYPGFSNASGSRLHIDNEKLNQAMAKFRDMDTSESGKTSPEREKPSEYSKTAHELIVDVVQSYDKAWQRLNTPKNSVGINNLGKENTEVKTPLKLPLVVPTSNKKQLGMPRMSNFSSISKEKLDRARLLFDDCDKDLNITPMKSFTKSTTLKEFTTPRNSFRYSPQNQQRQGERESFSLLTSTPAKELDNFALDVTPIRTRKFSYQYQKIDKDVNESDGLLLFREKSNSNLKELQNDIELEYLHLKKKLEILEERKKCLEVQRHVIDFDDPEYMRPRLGMLSIHKRGPSRVKLSALTSLTQENFDANDIDTRILEITPQNADKLHFNAARNDRAVVYTLDGAKVVPNTRNMIGVSEINNAFQAMHGIAPKLIPKGWVANHYRWIVWKLACYERKFPEAFSGCLSVESILQQLKYRYDREIDRAERSAIARIVERDDIPSKRIVLCVAEVIQMASHKYELLLTDGWYSIRTIIDNLLIREVQRGKITLGTKLIIQGAELSDGEACHPLEATDSLKLKINYNNTRRALWHLRLGYYHIPTPFPILLRSIHPDGGQITCIKVYIMRVYPVRYMEDYKGVKTWRNAKSEEKRATEFDAERTMEFERVKSEVYDEYEASLKAATVKKLTSNDLNMLRDPKDLYQYIEASNDPESVYEMLTPSQKSLLMEYKQNNIMERQREISERVMRRMEEKSLANRIVTPMIKILVSDASEDSAKCVVLNVWRPSEEQKMLLQEEHCFSVYNVVVKRNNELNTARRTLFQQHEALTTKRCQRQVLPISMTTDVFYKPLFNEFDTIGVVVEVTIREYDQEVWLADFIGRLLYVKIVDGPKRCSLLDPIKVGSTIACCNLIMHSPHTEFGQCVANQHSTISLFPHFKHLQQALELFKSHLTDVNKLVKDSLAKVDSLRSCVNLRPNRHSHDASFLDKVNSNIFDDSEENATIPSCLTMADVQMSLIDTDKFL